MSETSTSVQASSPCSLGQSLTGIGQTSAQNMSGQSTTPQIMQLTAMQSATQSGIQQNPLNIVQQPMQSFCQQPPQCVEGRQQHPQLYLHQQPSLQQTQLPQQPSILLQQQLMGRQPNLHPNQLIHQQNSVDMQQQHRLSVQSDNFLNPHQPDNISMPHGNTDNFNNLGFAFVNPSIFPGLAIHCTLDSEAGNPRASLASSSSAAELGILENNTDRELVSPILPEMETDIPFSWNEDNILSEEVLSSLLPMEGSCPLFSLHGIQDAKAKAPVVEALDFNVNSPSSYAEHVPGSDQLDIEQVGWDAASDTQMQNGWLCSSKLVGMKDPNNVSMVDSATNLKKRKFHGSSSSSTPVFGQATSTPLDDHTYAPGPPYRAIPKGASTTPSWEFQGWMPYGF